MKIKAIGLDLAKNVFQVHGVDEQGKVALERKLKRAQVLEFFAQLPACVIGMEACASAQHWARELRGLGHEVRLIAPQHVKAYVRGNKNDKRDAQAICEALQRPHMRFVPIKSIEQQGLLSLHSLRDGCIAARTALINQLRGLLAEFGVVLRQGRARFEQSLPQLIAQPHPKVPLLLQQMLEPLRVQLLGLNEQIARIEAHLRAWHRQNEASRRVAQIPGVGLLSASALVATIGTGQEFDRGRSLAAWVGITPGEHSSGGKQRLLGITKRGDVRLRTLFIHGARSVIQAYRGGDAWLDGLLARRPKNVVIVALAHRNLRRAWARLRRAEDYRPPLASPGCSAEA